MGRKSLQGVRKKQIVEAYYACLSERGHENITVKDIARRAGLNHGAIHYYFQGKDDLARAVVADITDRYIGQLSELLSKPDPLPMVLDHFVQAFVFDAGLNRVVINLWQMSFEQEAVRTGLAGMLQTFREQVGQLLGKTVQGAPPPYQALAVAALLDGFAAHCLIDPQTLDPAAVKKALEWMVRKEENR